MDLFGKINKEGKTVVMATHNKLIIDHMKKRTIELREGSLVLDSGVKPDDNSSKAETIIIGSKKEQKEKVESKVK